MEYLKGFENEEEKHEIQKNTEISIVKPTPFYSSGLSLNEKLFGYDQKIFEQQSPVII